MARKLIFLIRGKLGDSLIAYSVFKEYVQRHSQDDIALVVRRNYAELLSGEGGFRLIPYRGRLQMILSLLALRLFSRRCDVFAVLWGFGDVLPRLAKACGAARNFYLNDKYRSVLAEFPEKLEEARQVDPSWAVACLLDPALPKPKKLFIESLARRRRQNGGVIGVSPLSDEVRRNVDSQALRELLWKLSEKFPGQPLFVFVNPGQENIVPGDVPGTTEIKVFHTLSELVERYAELAAWYGTDTGLYHLAASMDIPCTLFFGPTQPEKIILPEQKTIGVRLEALSNHHCDEKSCQQAACLNQSIQNYCGSGSLVAVDRRLSSCLLLPLANQQMLRNALYENSDRQTR